MNIETFLNRCAAYCRRNKIALATLSLRLLQDSRRLRQLGDGGDIGFNRLKRAIAALEAMEDLERRGDDATVSY